MSPDDLEKIRERDAAFWSDAPEVDPAWRDRRTLLAHLDAITEAVRRVETAWDSRNGWHDVAYEDTTDALYSLLAILRGEQLTNSE